MEIKKFKFNGKYISTCEFIEGKVYEGVIIEDIWYFMDEFWLNVGVTINDLDVQWNAVAVSQEDLATSFEEVNYIIGVDLAKGDDYSVTN